MAGGTTTGRRAALLRLRLVALVFGAGAGTGLVLAGFGGFLLMLWSLLEFLMWVLAG